MHLHPPGDPVIDTWGEVHPVLDARVRHAVSLAPVPDRRVSHADDLPPFEPRVLPLNPPGLLHLLVNRPLDALVWGLCAAVQLQDAVQHPVIVHGPPPEREGLAVAPVVGAVNGPAPGDVKGLNHMAPPALPPQLLRVSLVRRWIRPEVLKKLPLVHVPPPIEPGLPDLGRELLEAPEVFRLCLHERPVVRHKSLNKGVVLRVLSILEFTIHKQPLKVPMAGAAWIKGVIGALREVVCPTDTCINLGNPALLHLPRLVGKPHVILRALVLPQVTICRAVAKPDGGAVWKPEYLVRLVIPGHPVEHPIERHNVVVKELPVGLTGNEHLNPRKPGA